MGAGVRIAGRGLPGILGAERLPHAGRSVGPGALRSARSRPHATRPAEVTRGITDRLPLARRSIILNGMTDATKPPAAEAQADQRIQDILRAADSWSREAPTALLPAI